jgi:hypothetical protein
LIFRVPQENCIAAAGINPANLAGQGGKSCRVDGCRTAFSAGSYSATHLFSTNFKRRRGFPAAENVARHVQDCWRAHCSRQIDDDQLRGSSWSK